MKIEGYYFYGLLKKYNYAALTNKTSRERANSQTEQSAEFENVTKDDIPVKCFNYNVAAKV